MKTILLFLLALAAFVAAVSEQQSYISDSVFLERQKDILQLYKFVNQPSYYKKFVQIGQTYNVQNEQLYTKPEVVKEFFYLFSSSFLPRGSVFSIYNDEHLEQAIALYNLFYYAKDFETFMNIAIWARQNVNEGIFVYSLSVALVQRKDTKNYTLPPIYEIYPQLFFSSEVIQEAQIYKQQFMSSMQHQKYPQGYVINANYTSSYLYLNKEQSLGYFTEDVGMNAFYYYYNIYYPSWLVEYSSNKQRPSLASIAYAQILAKYQIERLSNGLGQVQLLDFQYPYSQQTGFYPSLRYPNGLDFPVRPYGVEPTGPMYLQTTLNNFNYTQSGYLLQDYARRIRDAIDLGYVIDTNGEKIQITGVNGLNILINLMRASSFSSVNLRYYGSLSNYARYVYGYSYMPLNTDRMLPSALELVETSLRDPVFYQLYTTFYMYIQRYLMYQAPYTYKDLLLPGIKIQGFEISRLITYYDYFYADITNALYVNEEEFEEDNIQVQVRQQRLNHKPFNYKIDVESSQLEEVTVNVFIGPKYDEFDNEINMKEHRLSFALLDTFNYTLKVGQNILQRNSKQFTGYLPDRPSFKDINYRMSMPAPSSDEATYTVPHMHLGLPSRLMLPRGKPNGEIYQLYVFVGPIEPQEAVMPMLYPLDRFVKGHAFDVPNSYLTDVVIYFKEFEEMRSNVV